MTEWSIFGPLAEATCPDCDGFVLRPGPRGGLSQNFECAGCRSRFNILRYKGTMVWAERLPRQDQGGAVWREDMFPQVLQ